MESNGVESTQAEAPDPEWRCRTCEKHRGISVRSEVQLVRIGARIDPEGHIHGGRLVYVCFPCRTRGTTTIAGPPKTLVPGVEL